MDDNVSFIVNTSAITKKMWTMHFSHGRKSVYLWNLSTHRKMYSFICRVNHYLFVPYSFRLNTLHPHIISSLKTSRSKSGSVTELFHVFCWTLTYAIQKINYVSFKQPDSFLVNQDFLQRSGMELFFTLIIMIKCWSSVFFKIRE